MWFTHVTSVDVGAEYPKLWAESGQNLHKAAELGVQSCPCLQQCLSAMFFQFSVSKLFDKTDVFQFELMQLLVYNLRHLLRFQLNFTGLNYVDNVLGYKYCQNTSKSIVDEIQWQRTPAAAVILLACCFCYAASVDKKLVYLT